MARSAEETAQRERFEAFYLRSQSPVLLTIERSVCGCDYGGNSWTAKAEAEQMAALLGLRPGLRLLDLGAGSGWPGLYMGKVSGCDVVLVDLPLSGLQIAKERACKDGLPGSVTAIVADAAALPCLDNSFDAISHSDLLCCLKEKSSVLDACRKVIRCGGRMAFTVVSVAPGLSSEAHERAVANGPEFIDAEADYPELLRRSGWVTAEHHDITDDFADRVSRQLHADELHRAKLTDLIGAEVYAERVEGWRSNVAAFSDDLLRRELFVVEPDPDWLRS